MIFSHHERDARATFSDSHPHSAFKFASGAISALLAQASGSALRPFPPPYSNFK